MNKAAFPIIALFIGTFIQLVLMTAVSAAGEPAMPLLTLLLMTEFGVIVSLIGFISGIRQLLAKGYDLKLVLPVLACAGLVIMLSIEGFELWGYVNSID